jgi:hypothetical protein
MNQPNILIGVYVCFVILQMYVVKNYILDWQSLITGFNTEQMRYNLSHKPELAEVFTQEISSRMKMLDRMDYVDWINYNNKHPIVTHGNYEYDISIYERSVNDTANYLSNSHYTLRANKNSDILGLSYVDLLRQTNYAFLFSLFQPNPDFLETIYKGPVYENNINIYAHFTLDPDTNRAVKTNVVTGVWKKELDNDHTFDGVIIIEYSLLDVESQYSNKYFEFMESPFIVMVSIGTIISSLLLYYASGQKNFWMSLLFLSIINIYLTKFINTKEGVTTLAVESDKVKDINDGILSISFLAAVNIYILQTMKDVKHSRELHNESAFLFTLALVLLLFALYKKTNYNKIDDIRVHRIKKQFMYNTSIFVNLFILFNYLVYVSKDGNVINAIKVYLKRTL